MLQAYNSHERTALHNFFIDATLPITAKIGDHFAIIGTGTLFKISDRRFLVTAAHTLESFKFTDWAFPTSPSNGILTTFGGGDLVIPHDESEDVCIFELKQSEAIQTLERNWRFLTLANVWLPDLAAETVYLSGFPSVRARWDGSTLSGRMLLVPTTYIRDCPPSAKNSDSPVQPGVDFFLEFKSGLNELTGEDVSKVQMQGISGCSIWAFRQRGWGPHSIWSPEAVLKVIGVQSRVLPGDYFRAKSWGVVLRLLIRLDEHLRKEVGPIIDQILDAYENLNLR